jgi:DNA (cytosine-5)-methyltransferase 1
MHSVTLAQIVNRSDLLPTPLTTEYKQNASPGALNRNSPALGAIVHHPEWGKFAPAIHQWETITNNPAPPPTIPDGRDGKSRLNPQFAEWMMGLPKGWITDCDITRNEQLKACGNGVVPQQASLAITKLMEGIDL